MSSMSTSRRSLELMLWKLIRLEVRELTLPTSLSYRPRRRPSSLLIRIYSPLVLAWNFCGTGAVFGWRWWRLS